VGTLMSMYRPHAHSLQYSAEGRETVHNVAAAMVMCWPVMKRDSSGGQKYRPGGDPGGLGDFLSGTRSNNERLTEAVYIGVVSSVVGCAGRM
jgi:hypothetical protein